jgi:hypothetical protein
MSWLSSSITPSPTYNVTTITSTTSSMELRFESYLYNRPIRHDCYSFSPYYYIDSC